MSCGFGEYRSLCDYNGYNDCNPKPNPSYPFSFACSPGIGCHKINEAPNKAKNLYSSMEACSKNCNIPSSYDCVRIGAYGQSHNMCVIKRGKGGKYKSLNECRQGCEGQN